jgi:hypothetical protein
MQCVKCGGSIEYGLDQCPACGSFVSARAGGVPLLTGASGIPLAQFTPSTQGPPKSRDPYATATITYAPRKIGGYRAVEQPAHVVYKQRRRRGFPRALLAPVALLAALLGGLAFAGSIGSLSTFGLLATSSGQVGTQAQVPLPTTTTAITASPCQNAVPERAAAHALNQAQLTSRLRNAAKKDYRPTDTLTTAHPGQQVYLTFRIATPLKSSAAVLVCWQQSQDLSTVAIAARSNGHYAQIPLQIPAGTTGQATAVLTWNDQTAAVVRFTIEP